MLNVFEHQRFLLRRRSPTDPFGERIELSFRDLVTMPDGESMRFDYPLEYMNIAALNLCAALAQAAFEPRDQCDLAARLAAPMSPEEFEAGIAPLRDSFTIDGPSGSRFMQGPEPVRDRKGRLNGGPLSDLLLTVKKGDKSFLNRPDEEWAVRLDQVPLLLFARATFYEKSAGRGYLTGTSGDLEIRTYPIDPASLRRTIWLNVLTGESQKMLGNAYVPAGSSEGYDGWMWQAPPPDDVAEGGLSLRSGLFWMVANAHIEIGEIEEPRTCIVTGKEIAGRAGISVVVASTGRGYGVKVAREKGPEVRQSFFRHPNGPIEMRPTKEGVPYLRHLRVDETSGLIGSMAGLFFAASGDDGSYKLAPVVEQLYSLRLELRRSGGHMPELDLACFGFHMLSSKQNVHGGYEFESFHYPMPNAAAEELPGIMAKAHELLSKYSQDAREMERLLSAAIQRCMLVEVNTEEDEAGRLMFKPKKTLPPESLIPGTVREFWRMVGADLREFLESIGSKATSEAALADRHDEFERWWRRSTADHLLLLFDRLFKAYHTSPVYMVAAHKARGFLYATLRKRFGLVFNRADDAGATAAETTPQPDGPDTSATP